jgi:hypothetical protein
MDIFGKKEDALIINLEKISKSYISDISQKIVNNVVDGNADPMQEYIKAKGLSELSAQIMDGLKDEAIREAEKYADGDKILGCKFQVKNTPTTYDFSHDDEWRILNQEIENLKARQKQREKKMLDAMKYVELTDEYGELIPAAEIKKQGGQTIAITIPS